MFQVNPLLRIRMKNQALFSSKDKSKCRLLQFLFGALRVNMQEQASATESPQPLCLEKRDRQGNQEGDATRT